MKRMKVAHSILLAVALAMSPLSFAAKAGKVDVIVSGGELRLKDYPDTGTQPNAERSVNLSGAVSATFSFDFSTSPVVDVNQDQIADDYVSTFSSMGPTLGYHVLKPDLVAPGNRFIAAMTPTGKLKKQLSDRVPACGIGCTGRYLELSGTSMAAALVLGTVALMLTEDPSLTPATIKARLMRSARKIKADPI